MLLIDKPYKWTSFYAISKVRKMIKAKIGHAGTLDPLATGLLICCTGKFTKRISEFQRLEKEYTGTIQLGATTPTFDLESEPQDPLPFEHITQAMVDEAIKQFTGEFLQTPPGHSAVKKEGVRAYELARMGEEVKLNPRMITISAYEAQLGDGGLIDFKVVASTGTYVRTLAHDLGQVLGCGGHLSSLRRTRIGEYKVEDALEPRGWAAYWGQATEAGERKEPKE